MRYLTIFCLLISYAFAHPAVVESSSSEFALATTGPGRTSRFELCIVGNFPYSKTIYLLSNVDSVACKTVTLKSFSYKDYPYEVGNPLQLTPVNTHKCKQPSSQYILSYLGKHVNDYQILNLGQETNQAKIEYIDRIVRKNNLMKEWEEGWAEDIILKYPKLLIPMPKHKETYIVQYMFRSEDESKEKYGPLFFYVNNKVIPIDSEAKIITVFNLNGKNYLLIEHGCWAGCGSIGHILLEIKGDGFSKIFEDWTWSD